MIEQFEKSVKMEKVDLNIHESCGFYCVPEKAAFKCVDNREETDIRFIETKSTYSRIYFVLEGELKFKINKQPVVQKVKAGNFIMVPCNSYMIASVGPGSYYVICEFAEKEPFCPNYSLVDLMHDCEDLAAVPADSSAVLPVKDPIEMFLKSVLMALDEGMQCAHYHNIKKEELFILLCACYTREELCSMFRQLFAYDEDFVQSVLRKYDEGATDAEQLAALLHMPLTSFQRKFKKYFKTSVKQWSLDRKAERMLKDIRQSNLSMSELSEKYQFSSLSYFSNFCKHYFGKTPSDLREEYRNSRK